MLSLVSTDYFEFGIRIAECGIKKGKNPIFIPLSQHYQPINYSTTSSTNQLIYPP
jgi:hypothetical protein